MGRHQPAQLRFPRQAANPGQQGSLATGKHQPLQHRSDLQSRLLAGHQPVEFGLPASLPAEGVEAEVGPRAAQPRGQQPAQQLSPAGQLQRIGAQVGGKQHQPLPAATALLRRIGERLLAPLPRVEEQGGGVGAKQLRRLGADRHQGVGDQQAATGPVQAGHLHEGSQAQIQGAQGDPGQFVAVGQALLKQHPGAAGREAKPAKGQGQGKTPLPGRHPHLGLGEGPGHGRHRQFVFQA